MRPANRDISFTVGDDYGHVWTETSDGTTPINLAGYSFTAGLYDDDSNCVLSFGCSITSASTGVWTMSAGHSATSTLTAGQYRFQVVQTTGTGSQQTIVSAVAVVYPRLGS